MPNPTQRDEREKLDKRQPAPKVPPAPPPKTDISIGGLKKTLDERKKLLDET